MYYCVACTCNKFDLLYNKMVIFQSCSRFRTIVWLYQLDFYKTFGEKVT